MSFTYSGDKDIIIGFQGGNDVPLNMEDGDAYAGELGSIAGAVTTMNTLCTKFKVVQGSVTHRVDNAAALRIFFGPDEPNTTTPCFHLVEFIRAAIKQSPIKWIGQKAKGHQDREKSYDKLDKQMYKLTDWPQNTWHRSNTKSHQPVHECKTKDGQYWQITNWWSKILNRL